MRDVHPAVSQERTSEEAGWSTPHPRPPSSPLHSRPRETYPGKQQLTQRLSPVQGHSGTRPGPLWRSPGSAASAAGPGGAAGSARSAGRAPSPSARRPHPPRPPRTPDTRPPRPPPAGSRGRGPQAWAPGALLGTGIRVSKGAGGDPQLREALRAASWTPPSPPKTKAATHRVSPSGAGTRAPQRPPGPLQPRGSGRSPRGPGQPPHTHTHTHTRTPGILLTQGSNLHLLHWQADSLPLSNVESPLGLIMVSKSY